MSTCTSTVQQPNLPALILAAGRGERMRPLTDTTPKPLLCVHGKPLIEWHLLALAREGVREVVINTAWLEEAFAAALGDGSRWGLRIRYSTEGRDHGGALETAGGIVKALPWLTEAGNDAFWVVAGDIYMPDWRFEAESAQRFAADAHRLGHFMLVPNPAHHARGDFGLDAEGWVMPFEQANTRWNFGGASLMRAGLFDGVPRGVKMSLRPCMDRGIAARRISGEIYNGTWVNVGTPEQLAALNGVSC